MSKYSLVTGASTGIGRAISVKLAEEGSTVILVARRQSELEITSQQIEQAGGTAHIISTDLTNLDQVNNLIHQVKQTTDQLHTLVNVAGIWHSTDQVYADTDFDQFSQQVILDTYAVGLTAPTLLAHALIPLMPTGSSIINISGTFETGAKGWLPYYVSKRAIEDLTVGLAQELQDRGITVNAISPSDTATQAYQKFFPQFIQESIDPHDIAKFAAELTSKPQTTGQVYIIKKGQPPFTSFHY